MLFVGFGTSIGAALVADDVIVPVELGLIPFSRRHTFMTRLTKEARRINGQKRWQRDVHAAAFLLQDIFWPSDTVIGGGNAKNLDPLPAKCRCTSNQEAIAGAERLWEGADIFARPHGTTWRLEKNGNQRLRKREEEEGSSLKSQRISTIPKGEAHENNVRNGPSRPVGR